MPRHSRLTYRPVRPRWVYSTVASKMSFPPAFHDWIRPATATSGDGFSHLLGIGDHLGRHEGDDHVQCGEGGRDEQAAMERLDQSVLLVMPCRARR